MILSECAIIKANTMKKIFFLLLSSFILYAAQAQRLSRIVFNNTGQLEAIDYELPENVILKLSKDGNIMSWGANRYAGRDDIMREQLDPYVGRVEYYPNNVNEAFRGKIRSIGQVMITYYASYDNPAFAGKIQSIGRNNFNYYTLQENEAFKGNLKSIGSDQFEWYSTYDLDDYKGKLKSVANNAITYYTSLDDQYIRGKVKSIGGSVYTYYTSFDRKELRGYLKTGQVISTINGLKFMVKN